MTDLTRRTTLAAMAALPATAHAADAPAPRLVPSFDGVRIAVRTAGEGRPTLLMHGFLGNGISWFRSGMSDRLTAQGRKLIAIDFRGHGQSDKPTDPDAYPKDVLVRDMQAVLKAEGAKDFDIGGYSMGSLVAARFLVLGARPGRVVLGGMGDARVEGWTPRDAMFLDGAEHGEASKVEGGARIGAGIARGGMNGPAIAGVLHSLGRSTPAELKAVKTPVLVLCGDQDNENGSAEGLAAALGNAHARRVPGTHGTAPASEAFKDAMAKFLA